MKLELPMIPIDIRAILHEDQRYETVGDWFIKQGRMQIRVSLLGDSRYELLVAVHELVEAMLCRHRGITVAQVDAFDIVYEETRAPGDDSEPGDDPQAPYYREHQFATQVEKLLALELGVDWKAYEEAVLNLDNRQGKRRST